MLSPVEGEGGWRERFIRVEVVRHHVPVASSQAQGFVDGLGDLIYGMLFQQPQYPDKLAGASGQTLLLEAAAQ